MLLRCVSFLLFTAGAAVFLPKQARGHGAEFLLAKLSFDAERRVTLEMTADYGDNPMIPDEAEARAALGDLLRVEIEGGWRRLDALAPLRVEARSQLDLTSPMPYSEEANKTSHRLLVATWQWLPTGASVRFQVPKGSKHDVLFWKASEPGHGEEAKPWKLLIAEDMTPEIEVPRRDEWGWVRIAVELSGLLVIVLVVRALRRIDWTK